MEYAVIWHMSGLMQTRLMEFCCTAFQGTISCYRLKFWKIWLHDIVNKFKKKGCGGRWGEDERYRERAVLVLFLVIYHHSFKPSCTTVLVSHTKYTEISTYFSCFNIICKNTIQIPWLPQAQLYPIELHCLWCCFILTLNNQPLFFALGLQIYVAEQIKHAWPCRINQCGLHQLIFLFRVKQDYSLTPDCKIWVVTEDLVRFLTVVQHFLIQVGLVLCQEYVPEKCRANWIQISHLRHCFSGV
jgi:hypothetical protein